MWNGFHSISISFVSGSNCITSYSEKIHFPCSTYRKMLNVFGLISSSWMGFITQLIFISLSKLCVHSENVRIELWEWKNSLHASTATTTCIIFNVNLTHIASHRFNLIAFNNRTIFTAYGITRIEKKGKMNGWKKLNLHLKWMETAKKAASLNMHVLWKN